MKKYLFTVLILSSTICIAQTPSKTNLKIQKLKLESNSSLAWYKNAIHFKTINRGTQNTGTELVLGTRTEGGLKAEVGTNLTQASNTYTNNGTSPRCVAHATFA